MVLYGRGEGGPLTSTDCGRTWQGPFAAGGTDPQIAVTAVGPDGTLYGSLSGVGLFASKDDGRTWVRTQRPGLPFWLAASAAKPGVLYGVWLPWRRHEACGYMCEAAKPGVLYGVWLHADGKGVLVLERSEDAAQTWQIVGPARQSSFALDPFDADKLYAATSVSSEGGTVVGSPNLEVSLDGGATWEVMFSMPTFPAPSARALAIGRDLAIWIAGADKRIYVTRDQGATFESTAPPFPIPFKGYSLMGIAEGPYTLLVNNGANAPDIEVWTYRPPDFGLVPGHFYTQASGQPPETGLGYAVTNDAGIPFWDEFQSLGGVSTLGYPVSQRFTYKGFATQAFQKAVMQWQPDGGLFFLNVFDELHDAGKDDPLLVTRATPRQLDPSFDAGKRPEQIVQDRLALLEANSAIRDRYFSAPDPLLLYGLPTSAVQDMGNALVIRTQRAVFQQWKVDVPWASTGQVTIANGGDIAKEMGLFPQDAVVPEALPSP